ncbi:MAG: pectate lyase [Acidobacteria bacterium]|nr:pectate lyase [Acidobacteriota bacterium]
MLIFAALAGWAAGVPAFPGAEGFGARSKGGRGGKTLLVVNLNDAGPGSLRAACEAQGPRTVVFRVSGLIDLKAPIRVKEPFLTLAGQTAPGDGICLRGAGLQIDTHNVVVRHLRARPGDILGEEVDAIAIGGESHDVIVDHCSAGWSVDESLSPSGAVRDITVQWCIVAEGLNRSVHKKGAHGYGSLVRAVGGLTMHHNLWAHNIARNPRLGDNYGKPPFPTFDVRNNVMYDFGGVCSGMTGDRLDANYVANYIRPGPSSNRKRGPIVLTDTAQVKYFLEGNVVEHRPELTADNSKLFDRTEKDGRKLAEVVTSPFAVPPVRTTSAAAALEAVLAGAGATLPKRDAADSRIVAEVRARTGSVIDSQWEVGGWPAYRSARPPMDSDHDGLPDAWETVRGLNPQDASDAAKDRDGDGYTNLEEYINELARPAK